MRSTRSRCACAACTAIVFITCLECGKRAPVLEKKVRSRGQRFCSRTCANRWNARRRKAVRPEPIPRPLCACGCGLRIGKQAKKYRSGHNPPGPKKRLYGADNPRWSGGPKRPHLSREHRIWRELVFKRDDWTCVMCGRRSRAGDAVVLQAHHIVPVSVDPARAYDVSNGVTLCVECHRSHHWGVNRRRRSA